MILALDCWRPVARNPLYEVSITGRVRRRGTTADLRAWRHKSGHEYVGLGRACRAQVHQLVLEAFGSPRPPDPSECRHIDGRHTNNRASNLSWGTRKENVDDLKRTSGRYASASLSDEQVTEIRRIFTGRHGEQSAIARRLGLTLSIVNRIVRGRTYAGTRA